ncbi:MAG TPA: MarR family transcriptional regulator [Dehalococcoidia bacterium]|nr:MarR family transcriptional regulator [Dehalococcoidia bacterium]
MTELSGTIQHYNLWVLLHHVSDIIFNARQTELMRYGIPGMQGEVLFAIKAIGNPATPAQISRLMFRRPHSVSGILIRMEKAGLVKRSKDLEKKNLVRVTLTEKGERAYRQVLKGRAVQRIVSSLSESERRRLRSLLETLRNKGLKELGLDPERVPYPKFV